MNNQIIQGDCIEELKKLPENSVDAIITDPPYGLKFMGKKWDYDVPQVEMWKEALRVLKPGAFLLSFAGTRTYHRMACNIEDAGFEIRDMISWLYGCLSEDTEVLTLNGWERYHKNNGFIRNKMPILIYDNKKNNFKWEQPKRWQEYILNKDTCYRIKSNNTDQLVSKNHRCLVEQKGKLIFKKAEELKDMENMPTLSNSFLELDKEKSEVLFQRMQRILQGTRMEEVGKERRNKIKSSREQNKKRTQGSKKPSMERRSNLFQKERELWKIQNKISSLSSTIYSYGKEGWLCNGTPINSCKEFKEMFIENGSNTSYRPQSREQQNRKFNIIQNKQGTQNLRGIKIEKAKITKEKYSGLIFCPTVSTGCFVARRKGKIFITGNSGFPKSLNVGKSIDKLQGNEREVLGEKIRGDVQKAKQNGNTFAVADANKNNKDIFGYGKEILTKGNTEWNGWGTALKPAVEPIVVARKPLSEKNVALNVLKWGTGGININACRVGNEQIEKGRVNRQECESNSFGDKLMGTEKQMQQGRFPANLILDEEAGKLLDEQSGNCGGGNHTYRRPKPKGRAGQIYGAYEQSEQGKSIGLKTKVEHHDFSIVPKQAKRKEI